MPLEPFNKFMELPKETIVFNETMLCIWTDRRKFDESVSTSKSG